MPIAIPVLDGIIGLGTKLIERLIPDPAMKAEAKMKLLELAQTGQLDEMRIQMSAILAESQSNDPWTSRARPSFMYVMYTLILMCIPMGVLSAFNPEAATAISGGMTAYLTAIPDPLYMLFGTGYLGYTAARQWGKSQGTDK
jgi:hypothetical protein